jgi:hypothetical protein
MKYEYKSLLVLQWFSEPELALTNMQATNTEHTASLTAVFITFVGKSKHKASCTVHVSNNACNCIDPQVLFMSVTMSATAETHKVVTS